MKRICVVFLYFLPCVFSVLYANGVGIIDGKNGVYLHLVSSRADVSIENQVAIITAVQIFENTASSDKIVKFAFPLPESASATSLRWKNEGKWYQAGLSPTPQDTTVPGPSGGMHPNLKAYLGESPLFFDIEQPVKGDSSLIVEITYVQLLPYEFGNVTFSCPNDYRLIQSTFIIEQAFNLTLTSFRTISTLELLSGQPVTTSTNSGNTAVLQSRLYETAAAEDYEVQYSLSLDQLGLFSLSTYLPPDQIPDSKGGFFLFVAEPDPSDAGGIIRKVFTLIVDVSGSMQGEKIEQARNAAGFIVNHLNDGDLFNIIKFSTSVTSYHSTHQAYTLKNKLNALSFIDDMQASGATNISGAFNTAIRQFGTAGNETANIIIFFTDGQATAGLTATSDIVSHVRGLINTQETDVAIFNFGIGADVNKQLLTQLAADNNGAAAFLEQDNLEDAITEFYLKIQSPVLLNTQVSFSSNVISDVYPDPLPNLYQGQQMIVCGRYTEPVPTQVTLSGNAFGNNIQYTYNLDLSETAVDQYRFLPKVWAKMVIEHLLVQYYLSSGSLTEILKQRIVQVSLNYGVVSPFTSYTMPSAVEDIGPPGTLPAHYELLGNYPNPFNGSTKIRFRVDGQIRGLVTIRIFNALGQLVNILTTSVHAPGMYEVPWDGTALNGQQAPSGLYFYIVDFGDGLLSGKMQLIQ